MSSSRRLIRFRSSTYTAIIANPISDFLIKMHGHIGLFAYRVDSSDCFNPHRDRCNLIKHILRGFVLFASGNLNPSKILIYMSLFMDPYR